MMPTLFSKSFRVASTNNRVVDATSMGDMDIPSSDLETLSECSSVSYSNSSNFLDENNVTVEFNKISNDIKEELPLLALDSFVPIIENLPGLILENGTYYLEEPPQHEDLLKLSTHARSIVELVLTDKDGHPCVSSSIISCLARMEDPKSPFLSSLKRLSVTDADSALEYLVFCGTPSLEVLRVARIPEHQQRAIGYFLKDVVQKSRQLSNLVLGPGTLSNSTLNTALQFSHLRNLSIMDVITSLDFGFFQSLSTLPELESLTIEARALEYNQALPVKDSSEPSGTPFPELTTISLISTISLMHDLLHHLFPQKIEHVSLTLVLDCPSLPSSGKKVMQAFAPTSGASTEGGSSQNVLPASPAVAKTVAPSVVPHTFLPWLGIARVVCKNGRSEDGRYECIQCKQEATKLQSAEILRNLAASLAKLEAESKWWAIQKEERLALAAYVSSETTLFASSIEKMANHARLLSFSANVFETPKFAAARKQAAFADFAPFPEAIFRKLLSRRSLVSLEIHRWALLNVNETILGVDTDISAHSGEPSPMQVLRLPMEKQLNSGICISTLRTIACFYPGLLTFHCRIVPSADASDISPLQIRAQPHGLKELSVGAGSPMKQDQLAAATYLWSLFPSIQTITAVDQSDAEDWKYIHDLVKMCQTVDQLRRAA